MKMQLTVLWIFTLASISAIGTQPTQKNTVYLYADEGTGKRSLEQTERSFKEGFEERYILKKIDSQELIQGQWAEDAALFLMPGGADLPYAKKLNGRGNEIIKKYVEEGGAYLGICAGSYYGSSFVEFDKNGPLEVLGDRELGFFQGKAIGPALAPYDYASESGSRAAKIFTHFTEVPEVHIYCNGGGTFENAEHYPNTTVIANYEQGKPAIIRINCGQGIVILSAVHFEYDPYHLDREDLHLNKILSCLENSNERRNVLFKTIIGALTDREQKIE